MSDVDLWQPLIRDWSRALRAENKSPRTVDIYTSAAKQLAAWAARLPKPPAPGEVDHRLVRDFIAHLVETTSPGNANTNYRALQQWFKFLVNEEELDHHPMANMKPPHVPEQPVPVVPDDLLRRVLDTCNGRDFTSRRDAALIRLIFDTGARLSEVAGLTVDDIDLGTDVIHVLGKGRKGRSVPFSPKTGQAITRYLRARARHQHADDPRSGWATATGPRWAPRASCRCCAGAATRSASGASWAAPWTAPRPARRRPPLAGGRRVRGRPDARHGLVFTPDAPPVRQERRDRAGTRRGPQAAPR